MSELTSVNLPFRSPRPSGECLFDGCSDRVDRRGLCSGHYSQLLHRGELRPKRATMPTRMCSFAGCDRRHAANGWCASHRRQALANPERMWLVGDRPKKGRTVTAENYVKIWSPDHPNAQASGWVLEHVATMSAALGRPLWPDENVHHKNGVRDDNRPENLELWSHSQPKGQRVEDKVAWAIELLKLYQPNILTAE